VWDILERVVDAHPIAVAVALACLNDGDAVVRATACDLLGVLSGRHDDVQGDVATALIALAATEVDDDVRWSIARALGATRDARAVAALVDLAGHADSDVRFQAALSLPSILSDSDSCSGAGVAALIALCADDDPEVRNWATLQLSDGIAHPDNESSSNIHHTVRTRAQNPARMVIDTRLGAARTVEPVEALRR
jgi:HEAT repeat protein